MATSDCSVEALVAVSDLERAGRFYEDRLGLVPAAEGPQGVRSPCAQGTLIFVYLAPDNAGRSTATVTGWFVDELDQTMESTRRVASCSSTTTSPASRPTSEASSTPAASEQPGSRDPDGNTMALTEFAHSPADA
jgi:catechol 2,3-dioxygenase-like lactoylglutathione lyase family enzyme